MVRHHEADFLASLFASLQRAGVVYAVLRNYEALPASVGGSDLDLIVRDDQGFQAEAAIRAAINEVGAFQVGLSRAVGFFTVCVFGKSQIEPGGWWGVCIDVNVGLFFRGQPLLASGQVLPSRFHQGVAVVEDYFGGVLGVLKEVLNNGVVPLRYLGEARKAVSEHWADVVQLLSPMGPAALDEFRRLILMAESPGRSSACSVDDSIWKHGLRTRPFLTVRGRIGARLNKFNRLLKCSGKVIAFLGVDGAGKTTIIDGIQRVLSDATHNSVHIYHLRPTVLPPLSRLKPGAKRDVKTMSVDDPHGAPPSGFVGSLFRFIYLCSDYLIGYWLKIRPLVSKKPCVVIFDRYAYDMGLDQRRFRIRLPSWLVSSVLPLLPKPDVVICLYADPSVLVARKQELPLEEIVRQVSALHEFAGKGDGVLVETVGAIDDVIGNVLGILGEKFSR